MNDLTVFYLTNCPYCKNAQRAVQELLEENPGLSSTSLTWVEESEQPALADTYDYYYVPSIFSGKEKLYECSRTDTFEDIKANFRRALEA